MLLPILTRYLEPSEYGEVAVFQVWVSLISAICGLSVHGAASRKFYDYDDPDSQMAPFIGSCLLILILSSLVLFFFVFSVADWFSEVIGLSKVWLLVGLPFAFFSFLIQLRLGQWQVRKQPLKYGGFQISRSVLEMLLSLLLVVGLGLGVLGRLGGLSATVFVFGVLAVFLLYRDGLLSWSWRPDLMKEALSFGVPLIPHMIGGFLLLTIDRAVIGYKLGLESAGFYMVAAQLAMVLGILLDSVNKAFIPWLFERLKRDSDAEKRAVVKFTYAYGAFLLFCVVVAQVIGDKVLVIVAGEAYEQSGPLVVWLVLAQALKGMYFMVTNYIFYAKRTSVIAKITILSGLVNLGLLYFMIDQFGIVGAAWAACISMFLQFAMTWKAAQALQPMPWRLK
tara:strand:+ start:21019 stop:22200 length:1182 start_codon:yes stop_codon:yes gene_type:complete